jgi:hypothetical protein
MLGCDGLIYELPHIEKKIRVTGQWPVDLSDFTVSAYASKFRHRYGKIVKASQGK